MTQSLPFDLRVLNALTAALAAIAIDPDSDNPYHHNLGVSDDAPDGRVFRGRAFFGENDPLPMLSIIEDPRNTDLVWPTISSTTSVGDWRLLIQGFVDDDPVNPTDPAYLLKADVQMCLAKLRGQTRDILGFGYKSPAVTELSFGRGVVRPPDEISAKAYFWLPVTLDLAENQARPFT